MMARQTESEGSEHMTRLLVVAIVVMNLDHVAILLSVDAQSRRLEHQEVTFGVRVSVDRKLDGVRVTFPVETDKNRINTNFRLT